MDTAPATDRVRCIDGFLSPRTCALLVEEIDGAWFWPSTVVHAGADGAPIVHTGAGRRSDTTTEEWIGERGRRALRRIEGRVCALLDVSRHRLETWQATRYRSGGRFDTHHDSGMFGDEPAGERVTTVLIYLSTPRSGGATRFGRLGISVAARAGRLVVWHNLDDTGAPDPDVQHAAMPVRGPKLILTTWIRERPIPTARTEREEDR